MIVGVPPVIVASGLPEETKALHGSGEDIVAENIDGALMC